MLFYRSIQLEHCVDQLLRWWLICGQCGGTDGFGGEKLSNLALCFPMEFKTQSAHTHMAASYITDVGNDPIHHTEIVYVSIP